MKIERARIVDPERNVWYVAPAIAVSLYVFAYSTLFGQITILLFYALWFLPAALAPRILLSRPWPVLLILLVPVVFTLSTFWSDEPSVTLRSGVQYLTTFFCALVAARITSVPNLALGGTIGGLVTLLYSAMNGGYSYDFIDGSYAFNGAFSSKNQLGYNATLAMIFGLSMIWVFRSRRRLVPLALGTSGLAAVMLVMSDSATSLLAAVAAFLTIAIARGLVALARGLRHAAIALLLSAGFATGLAATWLGAFDAVLGAFGKDTTLTGRTYLWSQAIEIGAEHPWLGLGYGAFWTPGRPAAENLWEQFYITGRTGFHFHNLLMETYVGMGILGLVIVGVVCLLLLALPMLALLGPSATGSVMVCAGLSILFLLRASAEVDFITPYTAGSFLVAFVLLYLVDHLTADAALDARRSKAALDVSRVSAKRGRAGASPEAAAT